MKFAAFLFAAALAAPAAAVTYDPHADFSTGANPNGAYSYGYESTLGGALTLFTNGGPANGQPEAWVSPAVDQYLGVYNLPTTLLQHPGASGQYSVLRITLGAGSTYNIAGAFSNGDNASTDVHILANGVSLFSGGVTSVSSANFNLSQYFAAGTTIDFAVGNGGNGYNNDSTFLSASVAGVPEPAVWAMMLGGFGFAGVAMRRRRAVARVTYA